MRCYISLHHHHWMWDLNYFSRFTNNVLLMLALLMLPVGLSTLSIVHDLEMEPETHLQHQCEIYDAIQTAVHSSDFELPVVNQTPEYHHTILTEAHLNVYELPRTRSPPHA